MWDGILDVISVIMPAVKYIVTMGTQYGMAAHQLKMLTIIIILRVARAADKSHFLEIPTPTQLSLKGEFFFSNGLENKAGI